MKHVIKAAGLAALVVIAGCGKIENNIQHKTANTFITIAAGECAGICGGEICYGGIKRQSSRDRTKITRTKLEAYTITAEGFNNYFRIGEGMIFADECVLYKNSADADKLVLELLRGQ